MLGFEIGFSVLHTFPQRARHVHARTFRYEVGQNSGKFISNLLFQFLSCSWFWLVVCHFGPAPEKEITQRKVETPPIRKMVVRSCTNWKCKTWCCCILYEVQFFISLPLRNSAEHAIVQHIQKVTDKLCSSHFTPHGYLGSRLHSLSYLDHDQPSNGSCEV